MKYSIYLNGVAIEQSNHESLIDKVYQTFTDFKCGVKHFKGGLLSRFEWQEMQEKRLGLPIRGELVLFDNTNEKVIKKTIIPALGGVIKNVVDISELKDGDTVELNGEYITVDSKYIKKGFTGYTFMGSPFRNGITRITFKVPTKEGFRYE